MFGRKEAELEQQLLAGTEEEEEEESSCRTYRGALRQPHLNARWQRFCLFGGAVTRRSSHPLWWLHAYSPNKAAATDANGAASKAPFSPLLFIPVASAEALFFSAGRWAERQSEADGAPCLRLTASSSSRAVAPDGV